MSDTRHQLKTLYLVAWWLVLCGWIAPAHGHTIEGLLPLELLGHEAPFGFDQTETYTEVWGHDDLAYLGSLNSGVAIIDVSDPFSPWTIAEYGADLEVSFYDVRTAGNVGFFSTRQSGTHVVELSTPSDPVWISTVGTDTQGFDLVTNAMVYGEYLFQVSEDSSEIAVIDVSIPAAPTFVTRIDTGDTSGVYDLTIVDDRLYAAGLGGAQGEGATYIYDVTDFPSQSATLLAQVPTGAKTASAWPNSDHSELIVTHRKPGGGVSAWNISDLSAPVIVDSADASDFGINAFSAGPIFVLEQFAYLAWHQAGAQVLDLNLLDQTNTIFRTGAFGTSQASPLSEYVGNTSIYPTSHERVLLADSIWGLYIVDATDVVNADFPIPQSDLEATCTDVAAGRADAEALTDILSQLGIVPGDTDQNGVVEFADFLTLAGNFGQTDAGFTGGDFDCNGEVAFADFLTLAGNFGQQSAASVPEPQALWLAMFGFFRTFLLRPKRAAGDNVPS